MSPARPRRKKDRNREDRPPPRLPIRGGMLSVLETAQLEQIHAASLRLLEEPGMSEAPNSVCDLVCRAGGRVASDGRLCFPAKLVERALAETRRQITLCGRDPVQDLPLTQAAVYLGSGGAAPLIMDPGTGRYRPSTLSDLYDAARLVDGLDHVQFFSRSLVANDVKDPRALDVNTCFAALAGTMKHVMVSASHPDHVADIAAMCHRIAGGPEAFARRPFLSLNINHVAPPMRFSPDASEVLVAAARAGLPVMVNTFGQLGASSPVTIAGCLAQTHAETLAGMVIAWLVNPETPAIYGARPMVTDLRTGAMAGGSGEQALLTAAASQLARSLGLPNSTIAGATDAKGADAQAGYEKALSLTLAAQSGATLITQASGMQAGLMGASFEAYVIDNDMAGAIRRSLAPVEVNSTTLCPKSIAEAIRGDGHFLGQPDTFARMTSDFLYPEIADRRTVEEWEAAGAPDIRDKARERVRDILGAPAKSCIPADAERDVRRKFDILLPAAGNPAR